MNPTTPRLPPRIVKKGIDPTEAAEDRSQKSAERSRALRKQKLQETRLKSEASQIVDEKIRGVTTRNVELWTLFRDLARGDFRHDFNERVATRDLITKDDENRFMEIAKNVSKKGNVWLRAKFGDNIGKTIFTILKDSFDQALIPRAPAAPAALDQEFHEETDLLAKVGVDFATIKREMDQWVAGSDPIVKEFAIPGGITRSYSLRSSSYRLGKKGEAGYKQNRNITQMFREVTGEKNKFALIVDASGGLPLTEIQNTSLQPYTPGGEFLFIENIENNADSATKISGMKAKEEPGKPKPSVFFLKDTANTVVYPLWDVATDPKSNIYSKLKIALNRVDSGEIEANILIIDDAGNVESSISIGDVSNSSNVKNATLYALAVFLEKGLVTEAFVYTLIKRMGDWCQAISMLDLDREYNKTDTNGQYLGKTTLRDMLVDTEIGVVTNDRILLAFCILLGLNVYYTTAMDVARLIYFKNNNDVPGGQALKLRAEQIYSDAQFDPAVADLHVQSITQRITAYKDQILALSPTQLPEYIFKLKNFLSNIGKLRYSFSTLKTQHSDNEAKYKAANASAMDKFNAANAMFSTKTKIQLDIDYNTQTLNDLDAGFYPNGPADKIRLDALERKLASGGRITKSAEVTEAKNILLGVRDDIKQVIGKETPPLTVADINALISKEFKPVNEKLQLNQKLQLNYDEILSVTPAIKLVLSGQAGGMQSGGGYERTAVVFESIRTRSIRILSQDVEEETSTVNIYKLGDQYVDEKLRAYTVSDEFIVTSDDLPAFRSFFQGLQGVPPPDQYKNALYICLKYALLRRDIEALFIEKLKSEIEGLEEDRPGVREDPGTFEPGSIGSEKLNRIYRCLVKLKSLTTESPSFFADIMAIYNDDFEEIEIPAGTSIVDAADETRHHLLTLFNTQIPSDVDVAEMKETTIFQIIASEAQTSAGYFREAIVQRFGYDLGIIKNNQINQDESYRLGSIIESNLISPSIIPEKEKELANYVGELVRQAVFEWSQGTVPEGKLGEISTFAERETTRLQQLNNPPRAPSGVSNAAAVPPEDLSDLGGGGSRRPLYTKRTQQKAPKTYRAKKQDGKSRTWRSRKRF